MKNLLARLAILSALASLCAPMTEAAGIACSKAASAIEHVICAKPEIKAEDDTMAQLYDIAATSLFGSGPSGEVAAQRAWLITRDECATATQDTPENCVLAAYKSRNLALAFAAMPKAPALALKVLHSQNNAAAGMIEALTLFASEPDGTDWSSPGLAAKRGKIIDLITPYLPTGPSEENPDQPFQHFSGDLFEDTHITDPAGALSSTASFAGFLRAATYDSEATLPCAYVITHPDLLEATNFFFGATPDNLIINSNCRTAGPPMPRFEALLDKINASWPECDGTIRYAAYRQFAVTVDRALAASQRQIMQPKLAQRPPDANQPQELLGVTRADLAAAEAELAAAYVDHLDVPATKAQAYARARMDDLRADGQRCE